MRIEVHIKNDEYNHQLFQVFSIIEKLTWEEGGDGATLVLSNNPVKLTDLFDKYRINTQSKYYIRENCLFSDQSNENILFIRCDDPEDFFFHEDKDYPDFMWENKVLIWGEC